MTARYEFALKGRRHLAKPYHFKASGLPNVYLRLLFLAHVADAPDIAEERRQEAGTLMRPSQRDRRAPGAGPWLAAAQLASDCVGPSGSL